MVQLKKSGKSRKSFRKTRGRKTRQRKNEKIKSRKTRSTRKTGGLGESRIENKIKELASKIGELVKLNNQSEQKIAEIQTIFNWLIERKLVSCGEDVTCQRKKMIYYYIAVHLYKCFIYAKQKEKQADSVYQKRLIAKFEKHKTKYNASTSGKGTPVGGDDPLNMWKNQGEPNFISGIVEKLYNSILEEDEKAVGWGNESEAKYYGGVITRKILKEVEEGDSDVFKKKSIFVEWIEQLEKIKKIAESEVENNETYKPTHVEIMNRFKKWKYNFEENTRIIVSDISQQTLGRKSIDDDDYRSVPTQNPN